MDTPAQPVTADQKKDDNVSLPGLRVIEQLRLVYDPEIPVNVYDLGLIYKIDIATRDDGTFDVIIDMTLTTPNCPIAEQIPVMIQEAVQNADGVGDVKVNLVWDPPWDRSRMSDEARMMLDMF